jgi:hypothetical protein
MLPCELSVALLLLHFASIFYTSQSTCYASSSIFSTLQGTIPHGLALRGVLPGIEPIGISSETSFSLEIRALHTWHLGNEHRRILRRWNSAEAVVDGILLPR